MSKADDLKAKAQKVRTNATEVAAAVTDELESVTPQQRTTPVRVTVDLSPVLYAQFVSWLAAASAEEVRSVKQVHVIRAMVQMLMDDEGLQKWVMRQVRRDRQ